MSNANKTKKKLKLKFQTNDARHRNEVIIKKSFRIGQCDAQCGKGIEKKNDLLAALNYENEKNIKQTLSSRNIARKKTSTINRTHV